MKLWHSNSRPAAPSPAVERAAYLFYGIAALGSSIGQIWVGVTTASWPQTLPWIWRVAIVAPFALVIDLGGVVTAGFADARQRLGETALGWRVLSALSMTAGVGINVIGHRDTPYLAVVFGGLGCFAYSVWLMHSAARRRDALRAAGKLGTTPPVYGLGQWRREPAITRLARTLALQHGYGLHESLDRARAQLRDHARDTALLAHIKRYVTEQHQDPILASIAVTGIPTDQLAAKIRHGLNVDAYANGILAQLNPIGAAVGISAEEQPANKARQDEDEQEEAGADEASVDTDRRRLSSDVPNPPDVPHQVRRLLPSKPADVERYRDLWIKLQTDPDLSDADFADRHGISLRTLQRIRRVGNHGLLDLHRQTPSPISVNASTIAD